MNRPSLNARWILFAIVALFFIFSALAKILVFQPLFEWEPSLFDPPTQRACLVFHLEIPDEPPRRIYVTDSSASPESCSLEIFEPEREKSSSFSHTLDTEACVRIFSSDMKTEDVWPMIVEQYRKSNTQFGSERSSPSPPPADVDVFSLTPRAHARTVVTVHNLYPNGDTEDRSRYFPSGGFTKKTVFLDQQENEIFSRPSDFLFVD